MGDDEATSDNDMWGDVDDEDLLGIDLEGLEAHGGNPFSNEAPVADLSASGDVTMPLLTFRYGHLAVTNFTAQHWCEQQHEYTFTLPTEHKADPVVTAGSNLHLARELAIQDSTPVQVTSREDKFAVNAVNIIVAVRSWLMGSVICREIPVFGMPFDKGVFVLGIIDEIRCDPETFTFEILEFKTRSTNSLPSRAQMESNRLQVMIYKKLMDDLILGMTTKAMLAKHMKLDLDKNFGSHIADHIAGLALECPNLNALLDHMFDLLKSIPCISSCLVEYCYQDDNSTIAVREVVYDGDWLEQKLSNYMRYWLGERDAVGVPIEEAWKCQRCPFVDVCQWRKRKAEQCIARNALTIRNKEATERVPDT